MAGGVIDQGIDYVKQQAIDTMDKSISGLKDVLQIGKDLVNGTKAGIENYYSKDIRSFMLKARTTKDVWTLNDYKWYPQFETINTEDKINPPKIIIRELQPVEMFDWSSLVGAVTVKSKPGDGASTSGSAGKATTTAGKVLDFAVGTVGPLLAEAAKQATEVLLRNETMCTNGFNLATKYIDELMEYSTLKVYELPFFEPFMFKSGGGDWAEGSQGGLASKLPLQAQTFVATMPMPPMWQGSASSKLQDIQTNFNLINFSSMTNSTEQLVQNYKFMITLLAGSYCMQVYFFQKSSNLYSIECPGRFFIPYAQLDVNVTFNGKTRTNADAVTALQASGLLTGYSANDILFPDMYSVNITLSPKSINNYNTFVQSQNKTTIITNTGANTKYFNEIGTYHDRMNESALYTFGAVGGGDNKNPPEKV